MFSVCKSLHLLLSHDGQGRNRTADTLIFSQVLYQLSYLALSNFDSCLTYRSQRFSVKPVFDNLDFKLALTAQAVFFRERLAQRASTFITLFLDQSPGKRPVSHTRDAGYFIKLLV